MSAGTHYKCSENDEPYFQPAGVNRPARLWRVVQYRCNHSAFNGYHTTPSDYSSITCLRCGADWRTKASYVAALQMIAEDEKWVGHGYQGHEAAMETRGRKPFTGCWGDR